MISETRKQALHRYRWAIFLTLVCAYFFVYFHRMTVGILGDDMVSEVGGTVGILSSAYFWTYTLMQIPSGLLADSLGPRKASFIFLVVAFIGSFLTAFGSSFWMLVLGKILIAAGMAVIYIPLMKIVSVWFRKSDFPQLNGIVIAVGNVGAIAASAPLEMLSIAVGWRNVFIILGIITLILALLSIIIIRDHPHQKGMPSIEEIYSLDDTDATNSRMPIGKGLRIVAKGGRRFWTVALAYFLVYGSIMVFQGTWAKIYFSNVYDFGMSVAWFITMIGIGKISSTLVIGRLTSAGIIRSKRRVMMIGSFAYALTWMVIWYFAGQLEHYWLWFTVSFLFGFFGGFMTLSFTQVKEWYPVSISGTAVAAVNIFLFLGSSVFTTIAGSVIGRTYSLENFSIVWGLMFAASVLAFILIILSLEKRENDPLLGSSVD